jgi:integrase
VATLYKREGGIWWAWGYDRHGKRWRRSTKQKDKNAARTVAAKIEQELALDADQPRDEACTLEAACNLMIEAAGRADRTEDTLEFLTTKSRHLIRLLGKDKRCSKISLNDTTQYAYKRLDEGAAKLTVFYEIRTLIQALRRARKLGLYKGIEPALLKPEELAGAYVPRERWLSPDEYNTLLAELDPGRTEHTRLEDRRDYVAMWCQTGMRDGELYRLRPEHCIFEERVLLVPGTKTEKSRGRPVPMTPVVEEILRRRFAALADENGKVPTETELFPRWGQVVRDLYVACLRIEARLNPGLKPPELDAEQAEKAAKRRAQGQPTPKRERVRPPVPFDPVTPNDFRRTFASWLAQAGVPLFTAAKLLGHGSTKMLERVYARLAPQTLREAVARLPESVTNPEATKKDE